MINRTFTPENITELKPFEIFVFGSNMNGNHAGGAARLAAEKFGAVQGQAEGFQGQSYAIPTLDKEMKQLPLSEIECAVKCFLEFADAHPEYDFYLTKIGCGIAGFSVEDMASIFLSIDWTYRFNIIVPQEFCVIRGVKGFDKDMKCRDMQFAEGEEFKQDGDISCCNNGIHFCENPLQVFPYYNATDSLYHEVEGCGRKDSEMQDSKVAVSNLKVGIRLDLPRLLELGFEYTQKKVEFFRRRADVNIVNSGRDYSVNSGRDYSVNSGLDYSVNSGRDRSVNSGLDSSVNSGRDYSVNSGRNYSVNSGRNSSVNSGRDYSVNSGRDSSVNSGRDSSVNSGLDRSVNSGRDSSVNSGRDSSVCAGRHNATIELNGINSFGIAGHNSKIKGKKGCAICLVSFDTLGSITGVKSAIVDGVTIKEDTFYKLIDGDFVEVKD